MCCVGNVALLHYCITFGANWYFFGKNTQRNNPSKITKFLGGIGVEYNYICYI